MICSKCSEIVRPVVVLDIDGTLGNYHAHFIRFASAWLGIEYINPGSRLYDGTVPFSEWFGETFSVDLTTFRDIKLAYRQGGLKRTMPIFPGAKALADAAVLLGAELWLATTRPHDRFDRVDPDTREWLRRNEIPSHGLLFAEDDKMGALVERIDPARVCFVLDDLKEILERAQELFPNAGTVMHYNGFNLFGAWDLSVGDLLDARAMMTAHVQDWAAAHHFDDLPTTNEGNEQ